MNLSDAYRDMLRIRVFEEKALDCADRGLVPGALHPSTGHEAVPVGVLAARRADEWVVSYYRCHGHALAAGSPPSGLMREILGRAGGVCQGRAGSMHLADRRHRFLGASSIVAAQLPIAAGVAMAERTAGGNRAVVVFFGDGAAGAGLFAETLNIAAVLRLPLLLVCEDNDWQDHTPSRYVRHSDVLSIGTGFGVAGSVVDGNDVAAVHAAAHESLAECRRSSHPRLLVARTYLRHFHSQLGRQRPAEYRPAAERDAWRGRDPVDRAAAELTAAGVDVAAIAEAVAREMCRAVTDAVAAPPPDPATAHEFVTT